MKLVSDFHPRHPISGLCRGLFVRHSVTLPNKTYEQRTVTFPHSAYYIIGRKDYLAVPDKSPFEIHKKVRIQLNNS